MENRKLPVGIQSFEKIRTEDYVYVDKTGYIRDLVQSGSAYFLSRPRRFGKSLFTSTLEAYFLGKKELFHGLSIEEYENGKGDKGWIPYPVITFSLAGGAFDTNTGLTQRLNNTLTRYEQEYEIDSTGIDLPNRFTNLIIRMYEKRRKRVVVLVDEYDKPLLETIGSNPKQEEENRKIYQSFFSVLKDEDQYLQFVFITGVTKFSKVSIFSALLKIKVDKTYCSD